MTMSYKKLWKLLTDRDMKKKDLRDAKGISGSLMAKLARNANVTADMPVSVCIAPGCEFSNIMEFMPDTSQRKGKQEDGEPI